MVAHYSVNCLNPLIQKLCFFGQPMEESKETKIVRMTVITTLTTMILLFAAVMTIAPQQPAYSLSKYILGADNPNTATDEANGKIYQPLEQEQEPGNTAKPVPIPTTTSNSSIVPVGCAMDTIESLQSFLSCLGAK
jgi:hypothetical protein